MWLVPHDAGGLKTILKNITYPTLYFSYRLIGTKIKFKTKGGKKVVLFFCTFTKHM